MEENETSFNYESMTNPEDQEIKINRGEDGQLVAVYPSMIAQGFEAVKLPYGHKYGEGHEEITIRELPQAMIKRIHDAANRGELASLLGAYEGFLNSNDDIFDQEALNNLKSLFAEGKQRKYRDESQKAWIEKTVSFIKRLNMAKNPNYKG